MVEADLLLMVEEDLQFSLNYKYRTSFTLVRKGGLQEPLENIDGDNFCGYERDFANFYEEMVPETEGRRQRRKKRKRLPDFLVNDKTNRIICREGTGNR